MEYLTYRVYYYSDGSYVKRMVTIHRESQATATAPVLLLLQY